MNDKEWFEDVVDGLPDGGKVLRRNLQDMATKMGFSTGGIGATTSMGLARLIAERTGVSFRDTIRAALEA